MQSGPALLDTAAAALERLRAALLDGRADELPALSSALSAALKSLQPWRPQGLAAADTERLATLVRDARRTFLLLQLRQRDSEAALGALGAQHAGLQEAQARRTYAPAGHLAATSMRGRALGVA